MMRLRRKRLDDVDRGFSLAELLVSMTLFALLMTLVSGLMIRLMNQASDGMGRASSIEQARLGLSQIERQVRSGNVILDPGSEDPLNAGVPKYYSLRIYTQEGGDLLCAQWRVIDFDNNGTGQLQYREWDKNYPVNPYVSEWSTVANNVKMMPAVTPVASDSATWPPFWKDTTYSANSSAQSVRITLRIKDPSSAANTKPTALSTVVTGRNTVFGYSQSECADVPDI